MVREGEYGGVEVIERFVIREEEKASPFVPLVLLVVSCLFILCIGSCLWYSVEAALRNLAQGWGLYPSPFWLIPSALWILIVLFFFAIAVSITLDSLKIYGVHGCTLNILENLSVYSFIDMVRVSNDGMGLRFGFRILSRELYHRIIPPRNVLSVSSSMGQLSSRIGKDCDDWDVAVWWSNKPSDMSKEVSDLSKQGFRTLSCGGKKEDTIEFGQRFVEFLNRAGAELEPGKQENCFVQRR